MAWLWVHLPLFVTLSGNGAAAAVAIARAPGGYARGGCARRRRCGRLLRHPDTARRAIASKRAARESAPRGGSPSRRLPVVRLRRPRPAAPRDIRSRRGALLELLPNDEAWSKPQRDTFCCFSAVVLLCISAISALHTTACGALKRVPRDFRVAARALVALALVALTALPEAVDDLAVVAIVAALSTLDFAVEFWADGAAEQRMQRMACAPRPINYDQRPIG